MNNRVRILRRLTEQVENLSHDEQRDFWVTIAELLIDVITIPWRQKGQNYSSIAIGGRVLRLRGAPTNSLDVIQYGEESALPPVPEKSPLQEFDEVTDEVIKARLLPFDVWKIFIDGNQLSIAEINAAGPVSVIGNAGTGKTSVAIYRVRWLLQEGYPDGGRVLLASYSNTLVHDMRKILLSMWVYDKISLEEYKRVDVKTLDRLAIEVCKRLGRDVCYEKGERDLLKFWLNCAYSENNILALGGPSGDFLLDYFEDVILDYEIDTELDFESYLDKDLNGAELRDRRRQLWPLFRSMLRQVKTSTAIVRSYAFRLARKWYEDHLGDYCSIVVDEAQDVGAPELRMLAKMTDNSVAHPKRNSLFFLGDGFQRIYGREALLLECGINVGEHGGGRYRNMVKNYRSTKQIREFALPFIKNVPARNLDGEVQGDINGESVAEGDSPVVKFFGDYAPMNQEIARLIKAWQLDDSDGHNRLGSYAVLIRENGLGFNPKRYLDAQAKGLRSAGINAEFVDWDMQPRDDDAVKVMSMHRAKGLQFDGVVVIIDRWPYKKFSSADLTKAELKLQHDRELCVVYAAMTRAKSHLFVTGTSIAAQKDFWKYAVR